MSGNLGMASLPKGSLQINLAYDLNVLKTLKQGTTTLEDDSRERLTHSVLLEAGYSFSERVSMDILLPWVRQERTINAITGSSNNTYTQGAGDLTLLLKRRFFSNLLIGGGMKLPTGPSNERNQQGIPLNADLQPGSGAMDKILYLNYQNSFQKRPTATLYLTSIFRLTGTKEDYLGSSTYEFGNEFQLMSGISDQFLLGNLILSPSLRLRYRYALRDEFNGNEFSSSGGDFIFIQPGATWEIFPNFSYFINLEIPVYARVNESQLSPTWRLNTAFYLVIPQNKTQL